MQAPLIDGLFTAVHGTCACFRQVLLDEESLESERDNLRREASKPVGVLPGRSETSPGQPSRRIHF